MCYMPRVTCHVSFFTFLHDHHSMQLQLMGDVVFLLPAYRRHWISQSVRTVIVFRTLIFDHFWLKIGQSDTNIFSYFFPKVSFNNCTIGHSTFVNRSNKKQNLTQTRSIYTHTQQTDIATLKLNLPSGPIQWKVPGLGHLKFWRWASRVTTTLCSFSCCDILALGN